MSDCQVRDLSVQQQFPCKSRESGGVQCERLDEHGEDGHAISDHTIRHKLAGNGYACAAFSAP